MDVSIVVSIVTSFVLDINGNDCGRQEGANRGEVGHEAPVAPGVSPGECVPATCTVCGKGATH